MAKRGESPRAELTFLLTALESRYLTVPTATAKQLAAEASWLKRQGILRPEGHLPVVADECDRPVELEWSEGGFGYFSELSGWIDVPESDIQSLAIDVTRLLSILTQDLHLSGRHEPHALVPELLWDLGAARFGKRLKRNPVLFARRLSDASSAAVIMECLQRRPTTERRVILTSTSGALLTEIPGGSHFISVEDVLDDRGRAVDPALVAIRIDEAPTESKGDLIVRAGAKEVVFFGETFRFPKGVKQRAVILYLYKKYAEGVLQVPSEQIAEECSLGERTRVRDLFKKHPAWEKLLFEQDGICGFAFDKAPKSEKTRD
ncbi:hypothetical protein [Pseudorhodoplanes sp.]|uniref:hypothetical protein n=1 Tax=Pseudorhodoplanes sp. TaxID=1934341 RepID=UPI00391AD3D2